MNAKHTPGPWQINVKYKMSVEAVADGQGINLIAECCDPDGVRSAAEDCANARLIAAAPRMAAALQRAAHILAELPPTEQTPRMLALRDEIVKTIKQATPEYYGAAIAKARGE